MWIFNMSESALATMLFPERDECPWKIVKYGANNESPCEYLLLFELNEKVRGLWSVKSRPSKK